MQVLSLLKDLDFEGKMYSIKPTVAYFFAQNQSVGLKFDYNRGVADLANFGIDFDEDLSFSIRDVSYYQQSFSAGVFYRAYVGLDAKRPILAYSTKPTSLSAPVPRASAAYTTTSLKTPAQ